MLYPFDDGNSTGLQSPSNGDQLKGQGVEKKKKMGKRRKEKPKAVQAFGNSRLNDPLDGTRRLSPFYRDERNN